MRLLISSGAAGIYLKKLLGISTAREDPGQSAGYSWKWRKLTFIAQNMCPVSRSLANKFIGGPMISNARAGITFMRKDRLALGVAPRTKTSIRRGPLVGSPPPNTGGSAAADP